MARHVVILAGGSGTGLWPGSREGHPKHLLALHGKQSLLQAPYDRVRRLTDEVSVITERSQVESIQEQLPGLTRSQFIIEPARRGTASALGLAAFTIARADPGATMISVHADHYLGHDEDAYLRTLDGEAGWAEQERKLVTVGLKPPYPSTAFGYIRLGEKVQAPGRDPAYRVRAFVEKPDLQTADRYLAQGDYFWHLGLFSWPVDILFAEMAKHTPDLYAGLAAFGDASGRGDVAAAEAAYLALPTAAIDTAVPEETPRPLVGPGPVGGHALGASANRPAIIAQDDAG